MDIFGKKSKAELEETTSKLRKLEIKLFNAYDRERYLEAKRHELKVKNKSLSKIIANQREQLKIKNKSLDSSINRFTNLQIESENYHSQVETLSKLLVEERNKVNNYRESGFEELYETYIDRICEWADKHGLNYVTDKQVIKLQEEVGELAEAHNKCHEDDLKDSLGDIFVVITIIAYQHGWNIEDLIAAAYNVIKGRKGKTDNGTFIKDEDIKDADN